MNMLGELSAQLSFQLTDDSGDQFCGRASDIILILRRLYPQDEIDDTTLDLYQVEHISPFELIGRRCISAHNSGSNAMRDWARIGMR